MSSFQSWEEVWKAESAERTKIKPESICTFGIKCLDDRLTGILPNDLIAIGADSGKGKSQIVLDMAIHNAKNGKKVALFFLEGGAKQAVSRIKWKLISQMYYSKYKNGTDMDLRKWLINKSDNPTMFTEIENRCWLEFSVAVEDRLQIYDLDSTFGLNDLTNSLGWFMGTREGSHIMEQYLDVDLIIIDHLQYFDIQDSKNENSEVTKIVKKCKEITNFYNIPIIMVSHLRKRDKDRGLPNQEDFFGSSNTPKIASQAITITPEHSGADYANGIYPTFFRICKSRSGAETELATLCNFNSRTGEYDRHYDVYTLVQDKPHTKLEPSRLPKWAKSYEDINSQIKRELQHA